jgi:UDP-3-O-[3-hydroxymyristoyl] glucosamine N-acyltransferase
VIVAILGAGGHGQDIASIATACGHVPAFYDDGPNALILCKHVQDPYVVGVNDPATRRRMAVGPTPTRLVHPTATVASNAYLGEGCVVGAGSHIGPKTILGRHVHVGAGVTITRTTVGGFTTIGPGVQIAGDCTIGEECFVGVGAVIANLRTIGDGAVIGAGAVVVRDVAPGETVVTRDLTATGAPT